MGYRSEVVIAMTRSFYNKHKEVVDKLIQHSDVIDNIDTLYFVYSHVKWYDGYPEVDKINDFIKVNAANEDSEDDNCCLMRLGEELGDVEEIGNCYKFDLYVNQSISIPQVAYDTPAKKVLFKK